jgi:hypothetical protein
VHAVYLAAATSDSAFGRMAAMLIYIQPAHRERVAGSPHPLHRIAVPSLPIVVLSLKPRSRTSSSRAPGRPARR